MPAMRAPIPVARPGAPPLRAATWAPRGPSRPVAVVVFHHGYGEHVGRYESGE